jgi:two-component system chemotaxis response regulator CheB
MWKMTMPKTKLDSIRVVVVDDSPVARELLVSILQSTEDIQVVGVARDGEEAVRLTRRLRPDVVTMDIRMPGMDGLEATRCIMRDVPTPIVIVTASLVRADMDLTFEALRAGALTVVSKPGLADPEACAKVIQVVRLMSEVPVVHHRGLSDQRPLPDLRAPAVLTEPVPSQVKEPVVLPPLAEIDDQWHVQIIGIASSTGGPSALMTVLGALPAAFPLPILVVQHVAPGFVAGLADWLDSQTPLHVDLASHGEIPRPGTVLLAPDDYHVQVNTQGVIELHKERPYKGLRPSANYLFHSLACAYGPRAMGIVLTGMGDDGAEGLESLRRAGGFTVAQAEQGCVVYGMPREAIARDAVDRVLALEQIASVLDQMTRCRKDKVSNERRPGDGGSNPEYCG